MIVSSLQLSVIAALALSSPVGVLSSSKTPPATESASKQTNDEIGKNKALLNRLITELQRSSRSFIYLRSVGFTQTDEEFDTLIASNNRVFKQTRIVRRDEHGNRKIPGWPGIALKEEYEAQLRSGKSPVPVR